jgi:hypothetical protein
MTRIGQNKVIKILICVLIISIVSVGIYVVINAISPAKQLGIDSTDTDIAKVDLARVGNITITSMDLASFRIIDQLNQVYSEYYNTDQVYIPKSDEELLNDLIENAVLYFEAERQGLIISDDAVNKYIDSMKTYYAENKDSDVISMLREYTRGKGMILNEYLDASKPIYKQQLSIGNLRAKYVPVVTTLAEEAEKWEQAKNDIVAQYQSEIFIY